AGNTVKVLATGSALTTVIPHTTTLQAVSTFVIGNAGSLLGIGALSIENSRYYNNITIDGSADGNRTATIGTFSNPADSEHNTDPWTKISGLAPGDINFETGDTNGLTLKTGNGDSVTFADTPRLGQGAATNFFPYGSEMIFPQVVNGPLNIQHP